MIRKQFAAFVHNHFGILRKELKSICCSLRCIQKHVSFVFYKTPDCNNRVGFIPYLRTPASGFWGNFKYTNKWRLRRILKAPEHHRLSGDGSESWLCCEFRNCAVPNSTTDFKCLRLNFCNKARVEFLFSVLLIFRCAIDREYHQVLKILYVYNI